MKKDIKIKITNEDGSVRQSTMHEVFLDVTTNLFVPAVGHLVTEDLKKFKASGELADEVRVTESYFYG